MPITETHKQRKAKNYTLLLVILVVIVLFFVLTMIKLKSPEVDMLGQDTSKEISLESNSKAD